MASDVREDGGSRRAAGARWFAGRPLQAAATVALAAAPCHAADVRVAKGMYTRGYGSVRVSVVTAAGEAVEPSMAYQARFAHRWTSKALHSELWQVPPDGLDATVAGEPMRLRLPAEGQPTMGLLVADPCFTSRGGIACPVEGQGVLERLTRLLNQVLAKEEFHYWGILGDSFYDQHGEVSSEFFQGLSNSARAKPLLAVPGNHDFWITGDPSGSAGDQFGYGFVQFYGQDTVAASTAAPYNLTVDEIAAAENFIFGTQIGDSALFGYSGAHPWSATERHAREFCGFVGRTPTVRIVLLLGHWSSEECGCMKGMEVPSVYFRMKQMPGCDKPELRFLYFEGHMHCNRVVEQTTGPLDAVGFMIGGAGMTQGACDEVGFTVVQSVPDAPGGPNVRVDHFPLITHHGEYFELLYMCFEKHDYAHCRDKYSVPFRMVPGQPSSNPDRVDVSVLAEESFADREDLPRRPPRTRRAPPRPALRLQGTAPAVAMVLAALPLCVVALPLCLGACARPVSPLQAFCRRWTSSRARYSRLASECPVFSEADQL